MKRASLTQYDEFPEDMLIYLRNYGPHFNKKLCNFAVSNMTQMVDGREVKLTPYSKEDVERIMNNNGVVAKGGQLHDKVYVANMCKADFFKSSILDERHLALYVRDVLDDVDAPDGLLFNRWYADMCYMGIAVPWDEML